MWAVDGRQRAEWQRAALMTVHIIKAVSVSGEVPDINELIPKRYRPPPPPPRVLTPEQEKRETRNALALIGLALNDPNPLG
jgi:hypothetical protein